MWSSNAPAFNARRQGTIALLCASLIGCTPLGWSKTDSGAQPIDSAIDTVTIAAIQQASKVNTITQIKGRVGDRAPLLGKTAYELQDATGRIWVLASDSIPHTGDEVVVKGKLLYQSILLNGKEQGSVYFEQQQRVGEKAGG